MIHSYLTSSWGINIPSTLSLWLLLGCTSINHQIYRLQIPDQISGSLCMSIRGSHVLLQGSLLVDVARPLDPRPLAVVPCPSYCCWYILEDIAFLVGAISLWCCSCHKVHSLQPSQRHHFLTEEQVWPSLQPCYPCHLSPNIALCTSRRYFIAQTMFAAH